MNVKIYAIYGKTGEIDRIISCMPNMVPMQLKANERVVECSKDVSLETHWVKDHVVVEREDNPAYYYDGMIHSVPVPSQMLIGPDSYDITSSVVDLDLPLSGVYNIRLLSFPYKDKWLQVNIP